MPPFARVFGVSVVVALAAHVQADWPQYRGPNHNGISEEKVLAPWPEGGPKVLWTKNVGAGLGSFAVKDGRAFYMGADGDAESCFALDVKTGTQAWATPIGPTQRRRDGQGGNGPGSTPVVADGKVYVYGSRLKLACLNAADGKVVWEHDIQKDFNGQADSQRAIRSWGNTCSPVVDGDLVIVMGGGDQQAFLAFNKDTGAVAWKTQTEELTQATPTLATIHGVRQLIFLVQSGLVSVEPKTGKVLWKQPFSSATAIGASPVVDGDVVYASIGYGVGGSAFRISKEGDTFSSKQLWYTKKESMQQWSTPVIKDGHLYAIHGGGNRATLQCVELTTGKVAWNGPGVGQGEVMLVDGKLIVQCANGKLLLVDPSPAAYKEISSAQPLTGQAWGWAAYSNGIFLYRTTTQAAAVDLSLR